MENIYEWLFDHYASPRLERLPEFAPDRTEPLLSLLSQGERLTGEDALCALRVDWCTAAFELGVRVGVELKAAEGEKYAR